MPTINTRLSFACVVWLATVGPVLAQVEKSNRVSAPTGSDMFTSMVQWFQNHQGAGIAVAVGVVIAIGSIVYNRVRPGT